MSFGNTTENAVLDRVLSAAAYTPEATYYVALFTADPSDSGGGTEVSGGSYARVSVTNNATNFPAASGGSKTNGTAITFPTATAGWGTITAVALMSASSGGTLIMWGELDSDVTVNSGATPSFASGSITFSLD